MTSCHSSRPQHFALRVQSYGLGFVLLLMAGPLFGESLATAVAERVRVPDERILDGEIEAVDQSTVAAQTNGRVLEVHFDVGDEVSEGELLVRLRDASQRAAVDSAGAAVQEARVRRAEARLELDRVRQLVRENMVSEAELDRAQAEFDAAEARLDSARAQLADAEEELDHTEVVAPYSGVVVERHVETGELASPGTPLMTGMSLARLRAAVAVPQRLVPAVREAGQARIRAGVGASWVETEQVTVFPQGDPDSRTFRVRAYLPDNREYDLLPGMLVKVAFPLGSTERLVIPTKAVVHRSEVTAVYVVDEGRVRLRQIRPGLRLDDDRLEVLAGLEEGEAVALNPHQAAARLREQRAER